MAPQSDQTIQNATFPNVRSDINDNLEALFTQSSGSSEPTTKVAFQPWVDTSSSPPVWKIRNAANSAWITVGVLDPAGFTVGGVTPIANGGTGQTTVADAIAALLPSQSGNADKALVTNGTSLLWSAISSSSFTKYTFAAGSGTGSTRTHTWTKPATGTTAIVLLWGGGGGGGRVNGSNSGGGGGGGGACSIALLKLSDLGSTETITLGEGGAGATGNPANGSNGTNSTFGSHVTAYAGRGGIGATHGNAQRSVQSSTPLGMGNHNASSGEDYQSFSLMSGGFGGTSELNSDRAGGADGGNALYGGAGGAGSHDSAGDGSPGSSFFGGNGGAFNSGNGFTPGGGGGGNRNATSGKGGDGECWVLVF